MSKIPEEKVEAVVREVSERMNEPNYAQVAIGNFVQAHPDVSRFITAHLEDLGGGEAVMHAVFHAEVLHQCFCRHIGRSMTPIGFGALDEAAQGDPVEKLSTRQPHLASYVASNVDDEGLRKLLALVAMAMDAEA